MGSERTPRARADRDAIDRATIIRRHNDDLRCHARAGVMCLTGGIVSLGREKIDAVLHAVRAFDDFSNANDPYREHDFGAVSVAGEKVFWKIDYYDRDRRYGSPDPADPSVTTRVLMIMLASEY